jgi:hypothetical protein
MALRTYGMQVASYAIKPLRRPERTRFVMRELRKIMFFSD